MKFPVRRKRSHPPERRGIRVRSPTQKQSQQLSTVQCGKGQQVKSSQQQVKSGGIGTADRQQGSAAEKVEKRAGKEHQLLRFRRERTIRRDDADAAGFQMDRFRESTERRIGENVPGFVEQTGSDAPESPVAPGQLGQKEQHGKKGKVDRQLKPPAVKDDHGRCSRAGSGSRQTPFRRSSKWR